MVPVFEVYRLSSEKSPQNFDVADVVCTERIFGEDDPVRQLANVYGTFQIIFPGTVRDVDGEGLKYLANPKCFLYGRGGLIEARTDIDPAVCQNDIGFH